jgi:hypothetical protein
MWSLAQLGMCKPKPVLGAFVMRHRDTTEGTFVKFIALIAETASCFLSMTNASVYTTTTTNIYTVTKLFCLCWIGLEKGFM